MFGLPELLALFTLAVFVSMIFYLISLQKVLALCSQQIRTLNPGMVWLLLVPIFNLVWHFIVVNAISKSVHGEFTARNMEVAPAPGRSLGIVVSILLVVAAVPSTYLRAPFGIAALICWVIYWVKIAGFSAKLRMPAATQP
jgi:hypothetical protein